MTKPQFSDMYDMPVQIGSIVADGTIEDNEENYDIFDISYEILTFDPMSEIAEMLEVCAYKAPCPETGGHTLEYAAIYCIPVKTMPFGQIVQIWL